MGTCVLKDCGFEYQKLKIKKGITIEQYFKEIVASIFIFIIFILEFILNIN